MAGLDKGVGPAGVKFYWKADADLPTDATEAKAIAASANELDDVVEPPAIGSSSNIISYGVFGSTDGRSVAGLSTPETVTLQGEAKSLSTGKSIGGLVNDSGGLGVLCVALTAGAKITYICVSCEIAGRRLVLSSSQVQLWEVSLGVQSDLYVVDAT